MRRVIALTCLGTAVLTAGVCGAQERLGGRVFMADLSFDDGQWKFVAQGSFTGRLDRRGVYTMSHPSAPAQEGDSGTLWRMVKLAGRRPEATVLRFYRTDDYVGTKKQAVYYRDRAAKYVEDYREGVRFKQVLINDRVVWQEDVLGRNGTTPGSRFVDLEISEILQEAREFKLALRVRDAQDTEAPFATDVFWARVQLISGYAEHPPAITFPPLPERQPQFRPVADPPPQSGEVRLRLHNLSRARQEAAVLRVGLPFPEGAVTKGREIAVVDAGGRPSAVQVEPLCRWPDGSVRWAVVDFRSTVESEGGRCRLRYGQETAPVSAGEDVSVAEGDALVLETRELKLTIPKATAGGVGPVLRAGAPLVTGPLRWTAVVQGADGKAAEFEAGPPELVKVLRRGPLRATVLLKGWYYAGEQRGPLRYDLRVEGYGGEPYVRLYHTLTHESTEGKVAVRRLSVFVPTNQGKMVTFGTEKGHPSAEVVLPARLEQLSAGEWRLVSAEQAVEQGKRARGWVAGRGDSGVIAAGVRHFWEMYPKATEATPEGLRVDLWAGEEPFWCAQGEAITHELMLWLGGAEESWEAVAQAFAAFERPVVVTAPAEWHAGIEAWGPIMPRDPVRYPAYEAQADELASSRLVERERSGWYGMENFGDTQFKWGWGEALTYWSNTEYDHAHALFLQHLRAEDPEAFELGEQAARHYMDVDLIHYSAKHPDWVGAPHHHSETHTGDPPSVSHSWLEGMVDYWLLTGDDRAGEMAELAGKYFARVANRSTYGGGERNAGWNLIGLMGLYRVTRDEALLQAARKKVREVLSYQDPIRGVSSRPIFEQTAYEGGCVFMTGVLMRGLVMYYEETGDESVGWAIARFCDWIDTEMTAAPGRYYYKQSPQERHGGGPNLLVLDGVAFAYNFTGSADHRRMALDTYEQGAGSAGLSNMRDLPHALALLTTALPAMRVAARGPVLGVCRAGKTVDFQVTLTRLAHRALRARIVVTDAGGKTVAEQEVLVPLADTEKTVVLSVPLAHQGRNEYEVAVQVRGEKPMRRRVAAVGVPREPRILLFGKKDGLTARALRAAGLASDRRDAAEYARTDLSGYDVVLFGMDEDRSVLNERPQALLEWVKQGGSFVGFRYQGGEEKWLPWPMSKDRAFGLGRVLVPEAEVFHALHDLGAAELASVHGGSIYSAFYDLGEKWRPLVLAGKQQAWDKKPARGRGEHYGLVEADYGWGKIVLCQMIPAYAWLRDEAGKADSPGRRLFENLVAYASEAALKNRQ